MRCTVRGCDGAWVKGVSIPFTRQARVVGLCDMEGASHLARWVAIRREIDDAKHAWPEQKEYERRVRVAFEDFIKMASLEIQNAPRE